MVLQKIVFEILKLLLSDAFFKIFASLCVDRFIERILN